MKKFWLCLFVLAALALVPAKTQAGVKVNCIDSSSCSGSCHYIAWIEYTDPDGNKTGSFGSCCLCA